MKFHAILATKLKGHFKTINVEATNATEAQRIATKLFKTKRTVYVCHIDEEKGNASGIQLTCENKD